MGRSKLKKPVLSIYSNCDGPMGLPVRNAAMASAGIARGGYIFAANAGSSIPLLQGPYCKAAKSP